MQLNVMPRKHVTQFTLVHEAKCHSTIIIMINVYIYFTMTGLRATVCTSTTHNRHNYADTTWGEKEITKKQNKQMQINTNTNKNRILRALPYKCRRHKHCIFPLKTPLLKCKCKGF